MTTHTIRLHRVLRTTPERVYRAFLDADAMSKWLPKRIYGQVHHMDARWAAASRCRSPTSPPKEPFLYGEYLELIHMSAFAIQTYTTRSAWRNSCDRHLKHGRELVKRRQRTCLGSYPPRLRLSGWQESLNLLAKLVEAEIPE
jgi:uncharacterized protein YndB with AHSA1/START domain